MASLKEIASDVGVSHALVSRVLSNRMGTTRVSAKTRQAIVDRAKELNYIPNPLAVALKRGRKGAVGVFVHGVGIEGSELSLAFIKAAGKQLTERGYNLWMQFFKDKDEFLSACNEQLMSKVDGLILAGITHDELVENVREIEQRGLPVVFSCHGDIEKHGVTNFQVDSEAQCYLTTKHLLEQGCRRIAHTFCLPLRHRGYVRAHEELGLSPEDNLTVSTPDFTRKTGFDAVDQLMKAGLKFDAVCCQSDGQAAGVYQYYALKGIPRAEWPLVTGIDDSPIARDFSIVPLTSSTAEMDTCAGLAVNAIHKKIENEPFEAITAVPPRLIIRESTTRVS
ncbi:LacI family DNA-binding transcriptional regulator [Cerasicoccus arenae]|uniref:LacI family transcriptional regulator n=1 Tax=Cerasicoccus arenae TaxID=424488 RepID=A0A8J3GEK4_9BACT|nr:LacI family DNA-binding transcriptional regulator [Cerasicoccus arenae]MBK1858835.1 LacI family DNA-binding transcriptional regulator [Cerasicoccus arenae]GHC04313.1 LacI family transcriptional regulator [Cerasicoccus arenae]